MHMKQRVAGEPIADGGRLVRAVVIHHQMNVQVAGNAGVDRAQEFQKPAAAMPPVQLPDDFAGSNIERGKQVGRAMALVIVSAPLGHAGCQRQDRLGSVQRLNLALLVDTQHHGLERRVEIEPDDVAGFLNKQRIAGQLERFLPMRLQSEGAPDAADRRLRQSGFARHDARTPVRGVRRFLLQRLSDHGIDTRIADRARRSRARSIEQTVQTHLHKARAPFQYRLACHRELGRDRPVLRSARAFQHDARMQGQRVRSLAPTCPGTQLLLFRCAQHVGGSPHACRPLRERLNILIDHVPKVIGSVQVAQRLVGVPSVASVHVVCTKAEGSPFNVMQTARADF